MDRVQLRYEAWIGDAVLGLFARLHILHVDGEMNGEKYVRMTSNHFLSAFGDPTDVEAKIGRIYLVDGLEAAFAWVESNLLPRFGREEANRLRRRQRR